MEVYRGFDFRHYPDNWGSPGNWVWVSNSPFYADNYARRVKGKMLEFDLDVKRLKPCEDRGNLSCEQVEQRKAEGYNCFVRNFGYNPLGEKEMGYCIFDFSLLTNERISVDYSTL